MDENDKFEEYYEKIRRKLEEIEDITVPYILFCHPELENNIKLILKESNIKWVSVSAQPYMDKDKVYIAKKKNLKIPYIPYEINLNN